MLNIEPNIFFIFYSCKVWI